MEQPNQPSSDMQSNVMMQSAYRNWQNQSTQPKRMVMQPATTHREPSMLHMMWNAIQMLVPSGQRQDLMCLKGHTKGVTSLAFSPTGDRLVSVGMDGSIKLWDVARQCMVQSISIAADDMSFVGFTPDGNYFYASCKHAAGVGAGHGLVMLWNAQTGQKTAILEGNYVIFSDSGRFAATVGKDHLVHLWNPKTGQRIRKFIANGQPIQQLLFSQDDQSVLATTKDGTVFKWCVETGQEEPRFNGHSAVVVQMALSTNGRTLVTASMDGSIRLWDMASSQETARYNTTVRSNTRVMMMPRTNTVIAIDTYSIRQIHMAAQTEGESFSMKAPAEWVKLCPAQGLALVAYKDSPYKLMVLDVATLKERAMFIGHDHALFCAHSNGDGTKLATGSGDNDIRLWSIPQ